MGFDSRLDRSMKHRAKPRKQSLLLVVAAVFAVAICCCGCLCLCGEGDEWGTSSDARKP